jgi:hypothetical protein
VEKHTRRFDLPPQTVFYMPVFPMEVFMIEEPKEREKHSEPRKFSYTVSHQPFAEPEPILDPSSFFEEMDRGEGMAVDDEKTYGHTEK